MTVSEVVMKDYVQEEVALYNPPYVHDRRANLTAHIQFSGLIHSSYYASALPGDSQVVVGTIEVDDDGSSIMVITKNIEGSPSYLQVLRIRSSLNW